MWWRLVADFRRRHPMHACTAGQDSCIGTTWRVQKQSLGSGEIRSSDQLVLDRPASMAVDLHGTWSWKRPLSDAQSPVHAPLKLQDRMIRTRRGEPKEAARGSANRLCRQQPPCPPAAVKDQRRSSMLLRFNGEASASRRLELRSRCRYRSNSQQLLAQSSVFSPIRLQALDPNPRPVHYRFTVQNVQNFRC